MLCTFLLNCDKLRHGGRIGAPALNRLLATARRYMQGFLISHVVVSLADSIAELWAFVVPLFEHPAPWQPVTCPHRDLCIPEAASSFWCWCATLASASLPCTQAAYHYAAHGLILDAL